MAAVCRVPHHEQLELEFTRQAVSAQKSVGPVSADMLNISCTELRSPLAIALGVAQESKPKDQSPLQWHGCIRRGARSKEKEAAFQALNKGLFLADCQRRAAPAGADKVVPGADSYAVQEQVALACTSTFAINVAAYWCMAPGRKHTYSKEEAGVVRWARIKASWLDLIFQRWTVLILCHG